MERLNYTENTLRMAMNLARGQGADAGYRQGVRAGLLWALAAVATCGATVGLLTWWAS
ncbi:MAG: hypothetical protein V3S82_10275 [Dehalococcoidia bacterium]